MRRSLDLLGSMMVLLMVAAFRCPGPDPQGGRGPRVEGGGGAAPGVGGGGGVGGAPECPDNDTDDDQDGWTESEGDCNDCDPDVHPGAAELATLPGEMPVDDDCDGETDEGPDCEPTVEGVALTPVQAAYVIDLCDSPVPEEWGVMEARFSRFDGSDLTGDGAFKSSAAKQFGATLGPRVGQRMLVLSTGVALDGSHMNACAGDSCGNPNSGAPAPPGFPIGLPGCSESSIVYDDVALELSIRPPPNAGGFRFHSAFLSHEYPDAVCSPFRDQFVAVLSPAPADWGTGNVVFDDAGIPPSAEFKPFPHCDPESVASWAGFCTFGTCPPPPDTYCPQGPALLAGTGFETSAANGVQGGAATGWLETTVPLAGDEDTFDIRFVIADTDDHLRDSTVLIDGFTWLGHGDAETKPVTVVE